jgi:colanic acid/amylovoran biosynthesis glycosyltransferase
MSSKPSLGYFFSSFPRLSTTFLQREVRGLTTEGIPVVLFANRKPHPGDFDPQDKDLWERTFYLYPIRPLAFLTANLKLLRRRPGAYGRAVLQALQWHDGFAWQRLRNLARLTGAAVLAEQLEAKGIAHVHVHFAFGAAGVALLLHTLAGMTYSISVHGSDVLFTQPLIRQKLRRARFVVSNCRFHIDHLRQTYPELRTQRFYHLPLGIALNRAPWADACPPSPSPPLRILKVARFEPVKNHALLLQALADLKQNGIRFECRLVGDGATRGRMKALAASLGLGSQIEFTGALGEAAVAEQMQWAHVVVLSSLSEGTPMTLIEAMAKGRPVVAPDITGIPELVRHGETGLLYPRGSRPRLALCLQALACGPALVERMGSAGRRRAEELFDIARHTRELAAILEQELKDV